MKIFIVGNTTIFGTREGKEITGLVVSSRNITKEDLAAFIKAEAIDNLICMSVGKGRDVIEISLTDEQGIWLDTLLALHNMASARAIGDVVNNYFDRLRGK